MSSSVRACSASFISKTLSMRQLCICVGDFECEDHALSISSSSFCNILLTSLLSLYAFDVVALKEVSVKGERVKCGNVLLIFSIFILPLSLFVRLFNLYFNLKKHCLLCVKFFDHTVGLLLPTTAGPHYLRPKHFWYIWCMADLDALRCKKKETICSTLDLLVKTFYSLERDKTVFSLEKENNFPSVQKENHTFSKWNARVKEKWN